MHADNTFAIAQIVITVISLYSRYLRFKTTVIRFRLSASMLRILTLVLVLHLFSVTTSSEVLSYARVSKNGQLARSSHDSFSWITRYEINFNTTTGSQIQLGIFLRYFIFKKSNIKQCLYT